MTKQIQFRHHRRHTILLFNDVIRRKSKCFIGQGIYVTNDLKHAKVRYIQIQYFRPHCLNVALCGIKNIIALDTPIYVVLKHALYVLKYCFKIT